MATVDGVSRGAAEWMWRLGQTQAWGGWQEQAPGLLMLEQLLWSPGLSVLTPASVGKNSGAVPRGGRPDLFINFSSVTP